MRGPSAPFLRLEIGPDIRAPGLVRRELRVWADESPDGDGLDVELVVSELVSHAIGQATAR